MWKRRRTWLLLLAVAGLTIAGLYESVTRVGGGWLRGEAFYDGRPTSYWAVEIQQWECTAACGESNAQYETYSRRSPLPRWLDSVFPVPKAEWPRLFDGDADGLLVLQELRDHPSRHVQHWAKIGLERTHNSGRGPNYAIGFPDE